jgi:hypothetical protein
MEFKMNKKQKTALYGGLIAIALALLVWLFNGAEIFTKTQILVERKDELFGTTYKEWQDTFKLGLDYVLGISFISVITSSILIYLFKNKRKELI